MRYAFGTEHITAIYTTIRKLMNDGKRPLVSDRCCWATSQWFSGWRCC
ncbi:hypothetical protein [Mycobacterium leprae]|nr:hypothetical protein [Mycobacterium leprae]